MDSLSDFRLDSRKVNLQGQYRWDFVLSTLLKIRGSLSGLGLRDFVVLIYKQRFLIYWHFLSTEFRCKLV